MLPSTQVMMNRARPYARMTGWIAGAWLHWKFILAAAIVNLVTTNGLEATMSTAPWEWLREAFAGSGISWKSAMIQAIVQAVYSGAMHISETQDPDKKHR